MESWEQHFREKSSRRAKVYHDARRAQRWFKLIVLATLIGSIAAAIYLAAELS